MIFSLATFWTWTIETLRIEPSAQRAAKAQEELHNWTTPPKELPKIDASQKDPPHRHVRNSNSVEPFYTLPEFPHPAKCRQETPASSKHGQESSNQPHHLQFPKFQRLPKNENHPGLRVASIFTGPCCRSAMGLQWHERQRRLRSGRCERHPKKWTRNPKTTMQLAKHVLCCCSGEKANCRCLLQALIAHANKEKYLEKKTHGTYQTPMCRQETPGSSKPDH